MKTWVFLVSSTLGIGATGGLAHQLWPGESQAYVDIILGKPKYFIVSGPPSADPAPLDPVEQQLATSGVKLIGDGCLEPPHLASYNAVILRHYRQGAPK